MHYAMSHKRSWLQRCDCRDFRIRIVPESFARVAYSMVEVLRERTHALGLTQTEVAERAGLTQTRISRVYAHGVALTFEVALALCAALDLTLDAAYQEAVRRAPRLTDRANVN